MPLVSYPSSDDGSVVGEAPPNRTPLKRKRPSAKEKHDFAPPANAAKPCPAAAALPSLPSSFHDLYATAVRTSTLDDASLHGGRKRAVPHVEGQWPSHIYLEWLPSLLETSLLNNVLSQSALACPELTQESLITSPLGVPLPLHISLSAPLSLSTDQRTPFFTSITRALRRSSSFVRNFDVSFEGVKWVPNDAQTRWFLVLALRRPHHDELNILLNACNKASREFGLKQLYAEMNGHSTDYTSFFHFSIAWSLTGPTDVLAKDIKALRLIEDTKVSINAVKVKIGDSVTSIALAVESDDSRGVLG